MLYTIHGLRQKYGFGYNTIHRLQEAGVLPKPINVKPHRRLYNLTKKDLQTLEKLIKNRGKRLLPPSMQPNTMGRPKIKI